jgi:hypothetical protein
MWTALALALGKPVLKAPRLYQFACFSYWKAEKSPNKHPLGPFVTPETNQALNATT